MARTFQTIRDKIVSKVTAITDIEQVYTDPVANFAKYPCAVVYISEQGADYHTTADNTRTYTFIVQLFFETQNSGIADAMIGMYEVVDQVLDAFDSDETLTGISMPAGKDLIAVRPVPSEWLYSEERELLTTQVKLEILITSLNS